MTKQKESAVETTTTIDATTGMKIKLPDPLSKERIQELVKLFM